MSVDDFNFEVARAYDVIHAKLTSGLELASASAISPPSIWLQNILRPSLIVLL
jgi:hypothetical protein